MISLKPLLLKKAYELVEEKIDTYQHAMESAQNAANHESKSSAGDKYETTRALMQIERDNLAKQLAASLKLKQALDQIKPNAVFDTCDFGSIVITEKQRYFISISAGVLNVESKSYILLSPTSPLGKQLKDLKKGDSFAFNKETHQIQDIL